MAKKPPTKKPASKDAQVIWTEFNGLADSFWSGITGSFYKFVGLDMHSKRGSVQVQQKLTKDSGATVTELCKVALSVSDGSHLWFSYTTGKIWRENSGTYTLVYTTSPTTGSAGCLGAAEYNGKVYWATQNYLHYVATTDLTAFASATPNFQLFGVTDANWHPMEVQNNALFIGDGHQIAKVDSTNTYNPGGLIPLELVAPNTITCLQAYDVDLVIGTRVGTTIPSAVNQCWIVRWDTIQTSWQYMEPVQENGINCLFWSGQTLFAQAGQYGMIYYFDGKTLEPFKRIPALNNSWSPSNQGTIQANSATIFNNVAVFGFSADNGNPCDTVGYTMGAYSRDYPTALGEDFPISSGNLTGVTIGAILSSSQNLWISWQDTNSSTFGIDKIDYSNKYASAFLETIIVALDHKPESFTQYQRMFANYQSMPASTSISFSYYANWGSKIATTNAAVNDTTYQTMYVDEGVDARVIRMRIDFTVSANTSPVLESVGLLPSVQ